MYMLELGMNSDVRVFLTVEVMIFAVFGFVLFFTFFEDIKDKIKCKVKISARIVDFDDKNGLYTGVKGKWNSHTHFPAIYEYTYNGTTYRHRSKKFVPTDKFMLNHFVDIYINPKNPNHVYENGSTGMGLIVGGFVVTFILLSLFFWNFIVG